jgi:long-subunit acyl-CoA synthetase (AMP-forming)
LLVPRPDASAQSIDQAVKRANARLPDYAQVRDWLVLDVPFTVENGLWTGTGRPRRMEIEARYRDKIERAYEVFSAD